MRFYEVSQEIESHQNNSPVRAAAGAQEKKDGIG
jgi:hypothetical protein